MIVLLIQKYPKKLSLSSIFIHEMLCLRGLKLIYLQYYTESLKKYLVITNTLDVLTCAHGNVFQGAMVSHDQQ